MGPQDKTRLDDIETDVQALKHKLAIQGTPPDTNKEKTRLSNPLNSQEKSAVKSQIVYPITVNLAGTSAATATNYGIFFTCVGSFTVVAASEVHTTKGTDASAVSLNIEKLTGTTAPDSGTALMSTAFDLKGNINTVQTAKFTTTFGATVLKDGDRLCLKDSGTLTAVAGVQVTVYITPI